MGRREEEGLGVAVPGMANGKSREKRRKEGEKGGKRC
jgi:hypothetical protein